MKVHGVVIWPPPQPSNEAQKQTSWAASGISILPPVAMHMRSDAASAPANAQQQPQLDWSRMSPMVLAHDGQLVSESKASGTGASEVEMKRSASPEATARSTWGERERQRRRRRRTEEKRFGGEKV